MNTTTGRNWMSNFRFWISTVTMNCRTKYLNQILRWRVMKWCLTALYIVWHACMAHIWWHHCSTAAHFSMAFTPAFTTASPWTTGLGKKHFRSGSGHMHISMGNWSWSTVSKALRPCTSFDLFSAVPGLMVPHDGRSRWLFLPHTNSNVLPSLLPAICQGSTSRVDWLAASQLLEDLKGIYYIFIVIAYSLEEFLYLSLPQYFIYIQGT